MFQLPPLSPEQRALVERVAVLARERFAPRAMPPSNDRCLETIGKILCGLKAATLEFE